MTDIFNLLHLIRLNDLQIYYAFLSTLSFKGYTHAGSYFRLLIYYDRGARRKLEVTIYRVRIRGSLSSRTMSLRPASFRFHSPYSIRFVLETIYAYRHRPSSVNVDSFCEERRISRKTLFHWLRLLEENHDMWHRILSDLKAMSDRLLSEKPDILSSFPDHAVFVHGFSAPLPVSFASLLAKNLPPPPIGRN